MFLLLQGPHGPFFGQLGRALSRTGAGVMRVGFNAGDAVFWPDRKTYIPWRGHAEDWPAAFEALLAQHGVTDVVLYGDVRPVHAEAIAKARAADVTVHVFEEGYLRPWWVTLEQGGTNGNSRLMDLSLDDIRHLRETAERQRPVPPAHWGALRHHVFYGALYHFFVMFFNRRYRTFRPHRTLSVRSEFLLYVRRLGLMPLRSIERRLATWRIRRGGWPYHLALLQLEHDSSFQMHSPFTTQTGFLEAVIRGFAGGAPAHHHLVFKAHPLEDGRAPLRQTMRRLAQAYGLSDRVHYVDGGKLAGLLNDAMSAVTVNSTAGQQALWRGLPLRIFGRAVYDKPGLVSHQPVADFFADPDRPDPAAYALFRDFLLETSQIPGSFYAAAGRRQVLRLATDRLLSAREPRAERTDPTAAHPQQLRLVSHRHVS